MSTTTVTPDEDNVSSSDYLTQLEAMTPDVLHTEVLAKRDALTESFFGYNEVVMVTRQRMANGEIVGEETVWSKYVDRYLLKDEEKLPTALRRLSRLILKLGDGKTIDSSRVNHRPKSNRLVVEESIDREAYARGCADTVKANSFTVNPTVQPFPTVEAPPFVPPTVAPYASEPTAESDARSLADKMTFAIVYQTPRKKTTTKIRDMALKYMKLRNIYQFEPMPKS